jgi:hypothetical protein
MIENDMNNQSGQNVIKKPQSRRLLLSVGMRDDVTRRRILAVVDLTRIDLLLSTTHAPSTLGRVLCVELHTPVLATFTEDVPELLVSNQFATNFQIIDIRFHHQTVETRGLFTSLDFVRLTRIKTKE